MARVSTKENKNIYHKTREALHLTREAAGELAVSLSCRIADEMAPYVDGYYLMVPFHRVELVERIMAHLQGQALQPGKS